jgi:hypothetical protein
MRNMVKFNIKVSSNLRSGSNGEGTLHFFARRERGPHSETLFSSKKEDSRKLTTCDIPIPHTIRHEREMHFDAGLVYNIVRQSFSHFLVNKNYKKNFRLCFDSVHITVLLSSNFVTPSEICLMNGKIYISTNLPLSLLSSSTVFQSLSSSAFLISFSTELSAYFRQ